MYDNNDPEVKQQDFSDNMPILLLSSYLRAVYPLLQTTVYNNNFYEALNASNVTQKLLQISKGAWKYIFFPFPGLLR